MSGNRGAIPPSESAAFDPEARITLTPERMRELGYRVVDRIVEHLTTLPDQSVTGRATREELEERLREPMPEEGAPPEAVLERLEREVLPFMMHVDHPRFFAFVPGPGNFVGAMADALAAGFNVFQGTWLASSGPSEVELVTIDWLREMCGIPEGAGGLFVSGGSMANVVCLAVARHARLGDDMTGAVVYTSDQTHTAVARGLRTLGFTPDQLRPIATDERLRIEPAALEAEVAADRAAGRRPFCVVANAGTTNTGAVDPLPALADLCARESLWLHTDGAYGAATAISNRGRAALPGLDRVDSLALDPHKWLFQPFEIGCAIVRDEALLARAFSVRPDYLRDAEIEGAEVSFADRGVQLSRSFRALKLWMTLQVFGRARVAAAVERGMRHAEMVEAMLRRRDGWEIVTPAQLGIVCFRWIGDGLRPGAADAVTTRLVERIFRDGTAFLSSTRLGGRPVLRMCTINPRTTEADLVITVEVLDRLAREVERAPESGSP